VGWCCEFHLGASGRGQQVNATGDVQKMGAGKQGECKSQCIKPGKNTMMRTNVN